MRVKFQDCASMVLTSENSAAVLQMLDHLEDIGPVAPLAELLGGYSAVDDQL